MLVFVIIILLGSILYGYNNGIVKMTLSIVSIVLSMLLVQLAAQVVSEIVIKCTNIDDRIAENIAMKIEDKVEGTLSGTFDSQVPLIDQLSVLDELNLPQSVQNRITEDNVKEVKYDLDANGFATYIGSCLAKWMIQIISYILVFILVFIGMRIFIGSVNLLTHLPLVNGVNRLGGGLFGLGGGLIIVWISFVVVELLCQTQWGETMTTQINSSAILSMLHRYNIFF